ncbi:DUF2948 family protein [Pseudaminobacter sp. 19-2017]|uniref:DUF2948 family protein n=1 Tax=Pseudaminobacter soli (ex Zhang et al. 2022) TaxID=2831468 RepID=A0A942E4R0_9HYPH|nr:DUF2948 family protein [Pseudaminobacter soli]MBS3648462.1 DUF2948 family protein [Pseudaminobacter soli]
MDLLKLVALDEQDLNIVSAHVQDAIIRTGDLRFMPHERRFVVPMNRFAWETQKGFFKPTPQRRNSVLHFERVVSAKSAGLAKDKPEEVLELLAVRFYAADLPGGELELDFAGGATIRLTVECIEARLADLGGAWEAASRPKHPI